MPHMEADATRSVIATPVAPPCEEANMRVGEVISDGSWLGTFESTYIVPYDQGRAPFSRLYPLGWTNGTWYEQPGSHYGGSCSCLDCQGSHSGRVYAQTYPDQVIDCAATTPYDLFDHAINPGACQSCGCTIAFYSGDAIVCGGKIQHGKCGASGVTGISRSVCWPLVPFATCNPALRISQATEAGPNDCLTDLPAMAVDLSGAGAEGATFIGPGAGQDSARGGVCADSSAGQGLALGTDVRVNTGWFMDNDSCWRTRFWIKSVPDTIDGTVLTGYDIGIVVGLWPYLGPGIVVDSGPDMNPSGSTLTVTADWKEFDLTWRWYPSTWGALTVPAIIQNPLSIVFFNPLATQPACDDGRQLFKAGGRAVVKAVSTVPACEISEGLLLRRQKAQL